MANFETEQHSARRSPSVNNKFINQERLERRKAVLAPPASYWTSVGVITLLIGFVVLFFGIKSFVETITEESPGVGLLSFSLFGASVIIIGLLVSLLGILFIIAGINRRAEQRLEAVQFLSEEQSRYLKTLITYVAEDRFSEVSAELLNNHENV